MAGALAPLEILADRFRQVVEHPVIGRVLAEAVSQLDGRGFGKRIRTSADKKHDVHTRSITAGQTESVRRTSSCDHEVNHSYPFVLALG